MKDILNHVPFVGSSDGKKPEDVDEAEDIDPDVIEGDGAELDVTLNEDATYIVPDEIQVYRDKIVADGNYSRVYVVDKWPPQLRQDMFSNLIKSAKLNFDFALHLDPYEDNVAIDKLETIEKKLADKREGEFAKYTANKESIMNTEKTISSMKQFITQGERLFDVSMFLVLHCHNEDQLERHADELRNKLEREARLSLNECRYQQKKGLVSTSPTGLHPLADDNKSFKQIMLSSAVARLFPFIEDTFMESGGCLFGINENSMTPVFLDVFARANGYNMLTTGMVGSGKSFSTSQIMMEMERAYPDLQQYIIDPMGGFLGVNNCLDGDRIIIGGNESINPMEIKETPQHVIDQTQGKIDPWGMKKQELRWFFTEFFANRSDEKLSGKELSILDTAITHTYNRKGITKEIETHSKESPTILDLIDTLRKMAEDSKEFADTDLEEEADERRRIAISLLVSMDPFKEGGEYHNLAQPTEIDISQNDTIYLDLQQIPEQSDNLGIMMQLLFMKIYQNAKSTTDNVALTIDEAHKLMGDESITGGLEEMFRHSRHFNISINLISQTPEEFYSTDTAKTIAKQCTIKRFHRVDSLDTDFAKEHLEMNNREISFVENAEMGKGEKDYSEALLKIQDSDRTIPLRIEATDVEQVIIGYDPSDSISDFDTKTEQRLKHALDTYNNTDDPIFVDKDDELAEEVKASIVKKRRERKRVIAQKDPSLLTEQEKQLIGMGSETSQNDQTGVASTGSGDDDADSDEVTKDAVVEENITAEESIKRRLNPEDVEDLPEAELQVIANQYELVDNPDKEDIDTLRAKVKEEFFGIKSSETEEMKDESTVTNTDSSSVAKNGEEPNENEAEDVEELSNKIKKGLEELSEEIDLDEEEMDLDETDTNNSQSGEADTDNEDTESESDKDKEPTSDKEINITDVPSESD